MSELKPCPLCGHEVEYATPCRVVKGKDGLTIVWVTEITCPACRLTFSTDEHIIYAGAYMAAVAAWNRRPEEDALRARIKDLEASRDD